MMRCGICGSPLADITTQEDRQPTFACAGCEKQGPEHLFQAPLPAVPQLSRWQRARLWMAERLDFVADLIAPKQ